MGCAGPKSASCACGPGTTAPILTVACSAFQRRNNSFQPRKLHSHPANAHLDLRSQRRQAVAARAAPDAGRRVGRQLLQLLAQATLQRLACCRHVALCQCGRSG